MQDTSNGRYENAVPSTAVTHLVSGTPTALDVVIDAVVPTLPATTTAGELVTGTSTSPRLLTPKLLADEVDRRIVAETPATATAGQLETGTATTVLHITPKLLADEIDRRIALIP